MSAAGQTWARLTWAKSPRKNPRAGEPNLPSMGLFTHMLHASAVAMEIMQTSWGQWMAAQMKLTPGTVAYLVGLHDLGKCSPWALARPAEEFEADPTPRALDPELGAQECEDLRLNLTALLTFNATSAGGALASLDPQQMDHHAGIGRTLTLQVLSDIAAPGLAPDKRVMSSLGELARALSSHHGPPIKAANLHLASTPDFLLGARALSRALWTAICDWEPSHPSERATDPNQARDKSLQGLLLSHVQNELDLKHRAEIEQRRKKNQANPATEATGHTNVDIGPAEQAAQEHTNRVWALLAGLSTLCDWIASGQMHDLAAADRSAPLWHDPVCSPQVTQRAFRRERQRARTALAQVGFEAQADFSALNLPESRRGAAQVTLQMADHINAASGSFSVLRSPTGSGKTVAALEFIRELQRKDREVRGAHITLPTRAAGAGMWQTVIREHLTPGAPIPALVQGGQMQPGATQGAPGWRGQGREMIHPFGIGTIDQVLRAGMKGRFPQLRLTLLSRRVIVFDEIHAPGSYEHQLVLNLLPWLRLLGCHVLVMSATLDSERERELVQAWRRSVGSSAHINDIPPIVMTGDDDVNGRAWQDARHTVYHERPMVSSGQSGLRRLPTRLRHVAVPGQMSEEDRRSAELDAATTLMCGQPEARLHPQGPLWSQARATVLTRVPHAQELAARLRRLAQSPGDLPLTLHGGLSDLVRREREQQLTRRVGPPGSPGPRDVKVVATDVLGVSLDVDFDLLITDPADAATFLQRAGRAGRHWREEREGQGRRAEVVLLGPLGGGRDHPLQGHWALGHAPSSFTEDPQYQLRPRWMVRLLSERLISLPDDPQMPGARLISGTHHWHEGEAGLIGSPGLAAQYPNLTDQRDKAKRWSDTLTGEGQILALDRVPPSHRRPREVTEANTRDGLNSSPYLPVYWTGTTWHYWTLSDPADPLSAWEHVPFLSPALEREWNETQPVAWPELPEESTEPSKQAGEQLAQRRRLNRRAQHQVREHTRPHTWKSARAALQGAMPAAVRASMQLPHTGLSPYELLHLIEARATAEGGGSQDEDEPRPEPRLGERDLRLIPMRAERCVCGQHSVPTLIALDGPLRLDALIGLHLASDPAASGAPLTPEAPDIQTD